MEIIKNTDHYLLKNQFGEYHLSIEEFEELGENSARELAENEIKKKLDNKNYTNTTINFQQARELGFCEYGIRDFCKRLDLDIEKSYTIKELYNKLDVHTFLEYPSESLKLFTNKVFDKFGGNLGLLKEKKDIRTLNFIINYGNIQDNILHTFAYETAMRVIENFEKLYPQDDRPRKAIEAKKDFINGKINEKELSAAWSAAESAAWSAARSAAWSAAESAESAAESAAWSAARSAARSAAWSAAESAAWSAARSAAESAAWSAAWSAAESAAESAAWSAARSAARSAAWSAAESAAWSAARSAAWSAAWSAEQDFQINLMINLLEKK